MELKMYLDGQLIDSALIHTHHFSFIYSLKQKMEDKHSDILDLTESDPEFYIDGVPSRINPDEYKKPKIIIKN
jgi:hypothetical protein